MCQFWNKMIPGDLCLKEAFWQPAEQSVTLISLLFPTWLVSIFKYCGHALSWAKMMLLSELVNVATGASNNQWEDREGGRKKHNVTMTQPCTKRLSSYSGKMRPLWEHSPECSAQNKLALLYLKTHNSKACWFNFKKVTLLKLKMKVVQLQKDFLAFFYYLQFIASLSLILEESNNLLTWRHAVCCFNCRSRTLLVALNW